MATVLPEFSLVLPLSACKSAQKLPIINMLLYWGMFTVGFLFGSILAFVVFAPKKPEEDAEYETPYPKTAAWDQSGAYEAKNIAAESILFKQGEKNSEQNNLFAKKDPKSYGVSLTN